MKSRRAFVLIFFATLPVILLAEPARSELSADIVAALAPVRAQSRLPALAGAIVNSRGLVAGGVVGVRKLDSDVPATLEDQWHLGSDTKAMTATLIGLLIDDGKLKFESTIEAIFPDLASKLPERFRKTTVAELLAHRSGLPRGANLSSISEKGTLIERRIDVVKSVAQAEWVAPPNAKTSYSNWGYVILGAITERISGQPWETFVAQRIFAPLEMKQVGFYGMGTVGKIDQPWPHKKGKPMPKNGPQTGNSPVMAPAGAVHCPLGEWAKFIANELRGLRGEPSLLSPATFKRLHTPYANANYAGGWLVGTRPWAKGPTFTHAGSNLMNYAVAWLAPKRDVAFLVCTNEGEGAKPCESAVSGLIKVFEANAR